MSQSSRVSNREDPKNSGQKRAKIACRECRQAKIRCGLQRTPCPRCERLKLECSVDPKYQRSNQRHKVGELQQQIQHLQNLITSQRDGPEATQERPAEVVTVSPESCSRLYDQSPLSARTSDERVRGEHVEDPPVHFSSSVDQSSVLTLGTVSIELAQARSMFST